MLQDENATLNDKQIDKFMQKLIGNLQNKGWEQCFDNCKNDALQY